MRTIALALVVLLAIAHASPPIPGQPANAGTSAPENKSATNGQQPATPAPPATTAEPRPGVAITSTGTQNKGQNNRDPIAISKLPTVSVERDWVDYLSLAFNGFLLIVGIGGGYAAFRTLRSIQRQANVMTRQIDLQERAMRQWVNTEDWRCDMVLGNEGHHQCNISFKLVNPTSAPLTLPNARISFFVNGREFPFGIRPHCFLAPNRPHEVWVPLHITDAEFTDYRKAHMPVRVDGEIGHIGSLEKPVHQLLYGMLWCGSGGTIFREGTRPTNDSGANPADKQDPN